MYNVQWLDTYKKPLNFEILLQTNQKSSYEQNFKLCKSTKNNQQ